MLSVLTQICSTISDLTEVELDWFPLIVLDIFGNMNMGFFVQEGGLYVLEPLMMTIITLHVKL